MDIVKEKFMEEANMQEVLLKGGRVIDPSQNIDDELDVAATGDKIVQVAKDIPRSQVSRLLTSGIKL